MCVCVCVWQKIYMVGMQIKIDENVFKSRQYSEEATSLSFRVLSTRRKLRKEGEQTKRSHHSEIRLGASEKIP
jgi:hypothetical protein